MDREQAIKLMQDLLRRMVDRKGSDLFITSGFPPAIKIDGEVRPQTDKALAPEQSAVLVRSIMNDRQTREFDATKEANFAIAPPGIGRFRVSAFVQQGMTGCVIRQINSTIPTIEELELPPILKDIVMSKRGLVIVVGATGSGKSTTLAAMVGYRNEKTRGHIVTIEDPVEYVHTAPRLRRHAPRGRRRHRELAHGAQEHAAPGARRHHDRRDPRPRDDGVRHPVRRDRPPGARDAARQQLQPGARPHHQLLPGGEARAAPDGPVAEHPLDGLAAPRSRARRAEGRIAAMEILIGTPLVADLIFRGEVTKIKEVMARSNRLGMKTFDQALFDLYEAGTISYEEGLRNADSKNELRLRIKLESKREDRLQAEASQHAEDRR